MPFDLNHYQKEFLSGYNQIVEDFSTFLKFKSISADPVYKPQCHKCVEWLSNYLKNLGLSIELWEPDEYPVIFASHTEAGPTTPTLLIYNHYDVQPADPLELWKTPPFEPSIRDGKIYARGASDDKGQLFYVITAIKLYLKRYGHLPVNLKLLIEGQEESSSTVLSKIFITKQKELNADFCLVIDCNIPAENTPAITLGTRGICHLSLELTGSSLDLHSGLHGGMVYNPLHALVEMLTLLRDKKGRILVPGFYDDVVDLNHEQKKAFDLEFNQIEYEKQYVTTAIGGENDYTPIESALIRPTLEINGINGGYTGEGFKTVIPAKAYAKISARLVPDQNPEKVMSGIIKFLENHKPPGMSLSFRLDTNPSKALRCSPDSQIAKIVSQAYEDVFQKRCLKVLSGGSIPIIADLSQIVGAELLLMGVGLDCDAIHSPNEHFGLKRFEKGMLVIIRILEIFNETNT